MILRTKMLVGRQAKICVMFRTNCLFTTGWRLSQNNNTIQEKQTECRAHRRAPATPPYTEGSSTLLTQVVVVTVVESSCVVFL